MDIINNAITTIVGFVFLAIVIAIIMGFCSILERWGENIGLAIFFIFGICAIIIGIPVMCYFIGSAILGH